MIHHVLGPKCLGGRFTKATGDVDDMKLKWYDINSRAVVKMLGI